MAVDVSEVSKLDVEPGELPKEMAAWVIRAEREGEPKDAFQLEEIEVPQPGAVVDGDLQLSRSLRLKPQAQRFVLAVWQRKRTTLSYDTLANAIVPVVRASS